MDDFLLIAFFILAVGLSIGLGLLFYFVPKKFGYPNIGKYLVIIFGIFVFAIIFMTVFEDQMFTKNEARKLIEEQEILLADKFELEENKSMWASRDYYHTFTLNISDQDKQNAIESIKNSHDFKKNGEPTVNLFTDLDRYNGSKRTQNYETVRAYVREFFKPNGPGYAPTFRRIELHKQGNRLVFEDIEI